MVGTGQLKKSHLPARVRDWSSHKLPIFICMHVLLWWRKYYLNSGDSHECDQRSLYIVRIWSPWQRIMYMHQHESDMSMYPGQRYELCKRGAEWSCKAFARMSKGSETDAEGWHKLELYGLHISVKTGNLFLVWDWPYRKCWMYVSTSSLDVNTPGWEGKMIWMPSSWGDQSRRDIVLLDELWICPGLGVALVAISTLVSTVLLASGLAFMAKGENRSACSSFPWTWCRFEP